MQNKEAIIQKNIELMFSQEKGGLLSLLAGESMGGNAGHYKDFPCAGLNFLYTQEGAILYFGNYNHTLPKKLLDTFAHSFQGIFRYKISLNPSIPSEIIGIETRYGKIHPPALPVLKETVKRYNSMLASQIKPDEDDEGLLQRLMRKIGLHS